MLLSGTGIQSLSVVAGITKDAGCPSPFIPLTEGDRGRGMTNRLVRFKKLKECS